jgi:drug/metabolite transporter (DMT)-like permease
MLNQLNITTHKKSLKRVSDRAGRLLRQTSNHAAILMILSAACWGTGSVLSKDTLDYFPPLILLVVQLIASCTALWTVVLLSQRNPKSPVQWTWQNVQRGWIGILEPGLAYVFGLFGLAQTSLTSSSIISATEPILTIVLAWLFLREAVNRRLLQLIVVALAGTLIVSLAGADNNGQTLWGDALVFGSIICAAFYAVSSRQSIAYMPPLPMTAVQHTFGLLCALALLPIGLLAGEASKIATIPLSGWGWAIATGVVQYALAFLLYLRALKHLTAAKASLYLMLVPLFGSGGGVLLLGEQISLLQVAGAALILFALTRLHNPTPHEERITAPVTVGSEA